MKIVFATLKWPFYLPFSLRNFERCRLFCSISRLEAKISVGLGQSCQCFLCLETRQYGRGLLQFSWASQSTFPRCQNSESPLNFSNVPICLNHPNQNQDFWNDEFQLQLPSWRKASGVPNNSCPFLFKRIAGSSACQQRKRLDMILTAKPFDLNIFS